ncbi:MAG: hypothetical protein HY650_06710 [Acidobacteria bacterium]|nr:hypothetical protein [Acidobacteriota bacterium]
MHRTAIALVILAVGPWCATGHRAGGLHWGHRPAGQADLETAQSQLHARDRLTEEEWKTVQRETDAAKRVKRLADLAFLRLDQARKQVNTGAFDPAGRALLDYQVLLTAAFDCVELLTEGNAKRQRSAYKEFDIRTRSHMSYLERLAREFTSQNLQAGETVLTQARRLRARALNRFSGSKIIRVPETE